MLYRTDGGEGIMRVFAFCDVPVEWSHKKIDVGLFEEDARDGLEIRGIDPSRFSIRTNVSLTESEIAGIESRRVQFDELAAGQSAGEFIIDANKGY